MAKKKKETRNKESYSVFFEVSLLIKFLRQKKNKRNKVISGGIALFLYFSFVIVYRAGIILPAQLLIVFLCYAKNSLFCFRPFPEVTLLARRR